MSEEGLDFRRAHLRRVTLAVVQHVAPYPMDVLIFRADAVMFQSYTLPYLFEQPGRRPRRFFR